MFNLFYRNPRLLILAVCLTVVAGLSSYYAMPRMEDPPLTDRFAIINTTLAGAGAERVESQVTEPLEDVLTKIEEIKEIRSSSRAGISTINVELRDEVYFSDPVWSRVRDELADVSARLPEGASEPDFDMIYIRAYAYIAALSWTREGQPNYAILRRLAEQLKDELSAVRGTERVEIFGDPAEEVVVEVDSAELAARGLTPADLSRQIHASDAKVAAGQLRGPSSDLLLEVAGELDSTDRIGRTPIRFGSHGAVVQLADVARINKSISDPPSSLVLVDGLHAVAVGARVRSKDRIDIWSRSVNACLERFNDQLPGGVRADVVFDQNRYVESRLSSLLLNLLIGAIAVVGVVFVLMGWRSAIIVGSALPLSALMVLTGLWLLEIPIHQMSVTGLIIALGLLIDNAIIVVDEVDRKLRDGHAPAAAVSGCVRHLAVPLLGSTLTTVLAFAPIALMPGPAGEFVGSIAISVMLAVGSSFLLAMTVVPALAALGRRLSRHVADTTWWSRGLSYPQLTAFYRATLDRTLRRPLLGMALGVALPLLGFLAWPCLPEQFFPPADRDQFQIEMELPAHASLSETLATVRRVDEIAKRHAQIVSLNWFLGESAPSFYYNIIAQRKNTPNYAQALVQLNSDEGVGSLIHDLHRELDERLPAARILGRQLEQGPPFDAPIEVRLFGPSLDRLRELGDAVRGVLTQTPHVIHTRSDLTETLPKLALVVDEEQARLAGLTHAEIASQLETSLEGSLGGSVLEATEELPVRVRLSNPARARLARIASMDFLPPAASKGNRPRVPLTALAQIDLRAETAVIPRLNGRRMNEVEALLPVGVLPSNVLADFRQRLAASGFRLPPGYSLEYGGETAERDEAIGNLMSNVSVLLVLMTATLVLSLRSFRAAAIIIAVAVLAVGSGIGSLWMFGFPFGFMAIVGTMGLIGVAINDSIVVMAALSSDPLARQGDPTATREVIIHSTRHVVATSLTTMAGFTPLVLGGGGFWPPLAIAIAGGVTGATALALYFVPAAYLLIVPHRGSVAAGGRTRLIEQTDPVGGESETEASLEGTWHELLELRDLAPSCSAENSDAGAQELERLK